MYFKFLEVINRYCLFQKLTVSRKDVPVTATELIINGTGAVTFTEGCLTGMMDLRRIIITDSQMVVFRANAAVNLRAVNLELEMRSCGVLRFEKSTFTNVRGTVLACNFILKL